MACSRERVLFLSLLGALSIVTSPSGAVPLSPGDIVVSGGDTGKVVRVDPVSGAQTVLWSGGNRGFVNGIEIESATSVLVASQGTRDFPKAIMRVDLATGNATVVSEGGLLSEGASGLRGIALTPWGSLLVNNNLSVLEIDLNNGSQSVFSSSRGFSDISFDEDQNVLVAAVNSVIRIDPVTRQETVVTQFNSDFPQGLAVAEDGKILVSVCSVSCINSRLFEVDPITGQRTPLLDNFMDQSYDVELDLDGNFLVVGTFNAPFANGVGRIDRQTFSFTRITEDALNENLALPAYLKVSSVPEPSTAMLLVSGLIMLAGKRKR